VRLVQVILPTGKRDAVLSALDEEDIDYVVTDETSGREFAAIAYFPLPTSAVEPILAKLREVGLDDEAYTVVLDANTVVSRRFERLRERYEEETENGERIAREELRTTAEELAPPMRTYVVMTVVSAVIATAGLLLDSPAVVVGSMVIAPLIGPAMAAAVGTVIDDPEMFARGVKLQLAGFAIAIASAGAFAALVRYIHLVPPGIEIIDVGQIRERLAPDFLSLAVALGAGVAGAFSLSTGVSASLVGVMIAVALVPPAATVGIGLAWGQPMVVLGSGVLGLVNALSINLAALATLWYFGYRPERLFQAGEARSATLKRIGALVVAIALLSVFLGGVTYDSFQNAEAEEAINEDVEGLVAATPGVTHLNTEVTFSEGVLFRRVDRVVVTVGVEFGTDPPELAEPLDGAVENAVGHPVDVQVRYVTIDSG
jgi:uncharacterized hydrophobic protein (TIGR00341 family)